MQVIRDLMHDLGIEPTVILVNIVGFLILLALLRKYLFRPISDLLAQRQQRMSEEWDNAQQAHEQAEAQLTQLDQRTEQIMNEARREAQTVKVEVQAEGRRITEEAQARARERQQRAEQAISEQAAQAMAEVRDQVSELSAEFAEQVLRKSLSPELHQALIDAAIADIEQLAGNPATGSGSSRCSAEGDQQE